MMKYNRSWWAKKWFESYKTSSGNLIFEIGKTYSRSNEVYDIVIDDNIISGNVSDRYSKNYSISFKFEKFSKGELDKIKEIIISNQYLLCDILNYNLPSRLYDILVENDISPFPSFESECACFDNSQMCKHYFIFLYEIYKLVLKNPFLIFEVRGCDFFELIDFKQEFKTIDDIINSSKNPNNSDIIVPVIKDMLNSNLMLLEDNPLFFAEDFKYLLYEIYKEMENHVRGFNYFGEYVDFVVLGATFKFFEDKTEKSLNQKFEDKWFNPKTWNNFSIDIGENYKIKSINVSSSQNPFNIKDLDLALFGFFAEMNYSDEDMDYPNLYFSSQIYEFMTDLIKNHAIIPELFKCGDKFNIRWIPAAYDNNIESILAILYDGCPDDLITFNGKQIPKKSQVNIIFSLMFSGFLKHFLKHADVKFLKRYYNDDAFKIFFLSKSISSHIVDYINQWISRFYLKEKDYKLCFVIEKHKNRFSISISSKIDGELTALSNFEYIRDSYIVNKIFSQYSRAIRLDDAGLFDYNTFTFIYDNVLPVLEEIGIEIILPDEFNNLLEPKLILDTSKIDKLTLNELMKFDWKISIGDKSITVGEFEELVRNADNLVKVDGDYVLIDKRKSNSIFNQINNLPKNENELMQGLLTGEFKQLGIAIDEKLSKMIDDIKKIDNIKVPQNLNGTLRHYQETGFSWILQNMKVGFGSILADDMGLGKTIQVLTCILYLKNENKLENQVLVIAPTSLLSNWQNEIEKFTPSLTSHIYHGPNREFKTDVDMILTSYGVVRQDLDKFNELEIFLTIADEAQNIKNPKSLQTKYIKSLSSRHKIAISGTPIENRLSEYWSIFDFINPGYLSSLGNFKDKYINPIEKYRDESVLDNFKLITQPFILRRKKTDKNIVEELPEKNVMDIYCNLTSAQAALYQETLDRLMNDIEENDGISRKGIIFKLINSLKQICNHPSQYIGSNEFEIAESGKTTVLMNILETILENEEKVLIFTQYVKMGEMLSDLIEENFKEKVLFFHGSLNRKKREDIIHKFQNEDEYKILILSLKAGGTGLNLTAASNVIHYDLWWNPAVENQATDRAYRIGQDKNVMVYRFITKGTFEEKINTILTQKEELAEISISDNGKFITEMSDDELKEIMNIRNV